MSVPRRIAGGGSSGSISKTLANAAASNNNSLKKDLIYIPQGCYGVITPNTPLKYQGFYTTGLNTCSGLVVLATDVIGRSLYFCHADTRTNILDAEHGVIKFIEKLPARVGKVEIIFDDVEKNHYKNLIETIQKHISSQLIHRDVTVSSEKNPPTDMVVLRNGKVYRGGGIDEEFKQKGYNIFNTPDIDVYKTDIINFVKGNYCPICVFDGNKVLDLSQTYANQPWVKGTIDNIIAQKALEASIVENAQDEKPINLENISNLPDSPSNKSL